MHCFLNLQFEHQFCKKRIESWQKLKTKKWFKRKLTVTTNYNWNHIRQSCLITYFWLIRREREDISYPEPVIVLPMAKLWPAGLWATFRFPLSWALFESGDRERSADAPSMMPAAVWLFRELCLQKLTDASVEGPPRRFAMRLLGWEEWKNSNRWKHH